jgi:hypothetical protein
MSEVLTKIVHDCTTGITSEVPLTSEELVQREIDAANFESQRLEAEAAATAQAEAKASATAKLSALGLTAEEIAALSK